MRIRIAVSHADHVGTVEIRRPPHNFFDTALIAEIADKVADLTVFQRRPNWSAPLNNSLISEQEMADIRKRYDEIFAACARSPGGFVHEPDRRGFYEVSREERLKTWDRLYDEPGFGIWLANFREIFMDETANAELSEYIAERIRRRVKDPKVAELLIPKDHGFGVQRVPLETRYFEAYNRPNVHLVDLKTTPLARVTEKGLVTKGPEGEREYGFDIIVYATGFDAMTGAIVNVDITGRNGNTLKRKWEHGPLQYLGLMTKDFPNFYMITGPGSPSVLSNMMVSIEQHVDWITDTLVHMRDNGFDTIEPTQTAEDGWVAHGAAFADISLMKETNSWYMGANVPGKPRVMLPYLGGVEGYRKVCNEVVDRGYLGFTLDGKKSQTNDGIIRGVQPDVFIVLDMMAQMGLPPLETMTPEGAREFNAASGAMRPPGPEVGEMIDGTLPGADGSPLEYRLYRPKSKGPHPVVVYFHGGGWVIGNQVSDEPTIRDLVSQSNAIFVSVNYQIGRASCRERV